MKTKFLLLGALLLLGVSVRAEMSLVVTPMSTQEQSVALSNIGYIRIEDGIAMLYDKTGQLLGVHNLQDVRTVTYEEREAKPTSMNETSKGTVVRVYPNPTQDALVVENANCDVVRVFNLNGQILLTSSISGGTTTLNVSSLPIGTYLLQLNTEIVKFIKQ